MGPAATRGLPGGPLTVELLMRGLGPRGAGRGKAARTALSAAGVDRPAEMVERLFVAVAPNRLWGPT